MSCNTALRMLEASSSNGYSAVHVAGEKAAGDFLLLKTSRHDIEHPDGKSPLFLSVCRGQTAIVNWLLDHGGDVNECDDHGRSCLGAAAYAGHTDTVQALLQRGANVDQTRDDGRSPLIIATGENHASIVKMLLDRGASVDAEDSNGWTAMYLAARKGHCRLIGLLAEAGADVNAASHTGHTCLMAAVFNGHADVVQELIRRRASVNKQRRDGATALQVACASCRTDIVSILMESGSRVDIRDGKGWTPVHWAGYVGNVEIMWKLIAGELDSKSRAIMLLEHRVDLQGVSANALEIACSYGHMDVVTMILEVLSRLQDGVMSSNSSEAVVCDGRYYRGTDSYLNTPLHLCCSVQQAVSLLEGGADLEAENVDGLRPIHFAVRTGLLELVDFLISRGANFDATDVHGNAPLHEAVRHGLPVVELLVRNGARTGVRNNDGKTPYHIAAYFHKADVVQFLQNYHTPELPEGESRHNELHHLVAVDIGRNCMCRMSRNYLEEAVDSLPETVVVNSPNCCGHIPLHVARGKRAIEALLTRGNVDSLTTTDAAGRNNFHLVCIRENMRNSIELEAILRTTDEMKMKHKVVLDATDNFGRTPLHYAAMTQVAVRLVDHILGVVPDCIGSRDVFGRTPLHYELMVGASEVDNRSDASHRAIRDEFNMTAGDYGNCRHAYRIWEMFSDVYPGKDFTLISPEFVEENLRLGDPQKCSLRNAVRCIRGQKDPSAYINGILDVCQYRYTNGENGTAAFSEISSVVHRAMESLTEEISKVDDRLVCDVVAVGSAFERTKTGFCDEFDYMFVLTGLSEAARISLSPALPTGFVQLEPLSGHASTWKQLLTVDGLVNTQAVKLLFETVAGHVLAGYTFQEQNSLQVLNPVRYFDNINEHVSKKPNMKVKLRLSRPVNGVHILHDISVDIVPAIRVGCLLDDVRRCVLDSLKTTECHLVLVQPHWVYPWEPWSQTSALISYALAESRLLLHSPPVLKDAYMVVKHMAKYFSHDKWFSSHVVKTALLLTVEDENLTSTYSGSTADDEGCFQVQRNCKGVIDNGVSIEELLRWVRKVTRRLLCFAVQDFVPSFSIRNCAVSVWNNFEPYPKFSHMRLHRHRLTYKDLVSDSFCSDMRSGRVGDFQLVNIMRAFVCSHLMYWSVLSDNDELRLYFPPSVTPLREQSCWETVFSCFR